MARGSAGYASAALTASFRSSSSILTPAPEFTSTTAPARSFGETTSPVRKPGIAPPCPTKIRSPSRISISPRPQRELPRFEVGHRLEPAHLLDRLPLPALRRAPSTRKTAQRHEVGRRRPERPGCRERALAEVLFAAGTRPSTARRGSRSPTAAAARTSFARDRADRGGAPGCTARTRAPSGEPRPRRGARRRGSSSASAHLPAVPVLRPRARRSARRESGNSSVSQT